MPACRNVAASGISSGQASSKDRAAENPSARFTSQIPFKSLRTTQKQVKRLPHEKEVYDGFKERLR